MDGTAHFSLAGLERPSAHEIKESLCISRLEEDYDLSQFLACGWGRRGRAGGATSTSPAAGAGVDDVDGEDGAGS
jgi:hypothetical protein